MLFISTISLIALEVDNEFDNLRLYSFVFYCIIVNYKVC